ncbi:MAG: cellulase family glycosylhydrolase [Bacteroidaceae bacterium]|nr:cellulase family glycosylhydrolase [Bacteroidaceae bacterium]
MNIRKLITLCLFLLAVTANAQLRPALHVDGNQLRDEVGNKVVLHGVMDSPNPNANRSRWGILTIDDSIPACLAYFDKVLDAITDKEQGACADVLRFHIDPAWTNRTDIAPDPNQYGEADISRFSANKLKTYFKKLYWPLISKALNHGMYVIMRPPGVCQSSISVGGDYQEYLTDVWEQLSRNDSIKKYSGQISIELASDPIRVTNKSGLVTKNALRDFFQPIIDVIRKNGFNGIIWAPGTHWQSEFADYIQYPLVDENLGFAVHAYEGRFDVDEELCEHDYAVRRFVKCVPVLYTNPIMITETDWSPIDPESGREDAEGNIMYGNYGTWSTATTSNWGMALKAILDSYDNVGTIISAPDFYVDIDEYLETGKVRPGLYGISEACGEPFFGWYQEWEKKDYPSAVRYYRKQVIPENPFEFSDDCFLTKILYDNMHYQNSNGINGIRLSNGGSAGWRYEDEGLDLSMHDSLIVELAYPVRFASRMKIYDTSNYWAEAYTVDLANNSTRFAIPLHEMITESEKRIDESRIRMVAFSTNMAQEIQVKSMTFKQTYYDAINSVAANRKSGVMFDITGRAVDRDKAKSGIYIINGRKVKL